MLSRMSQDAERRHNIASPCKCGIERAAVSRLDPIRSLQRNIGNQAVFRLISKAGHGHGSATPQPLAEKSVDTAASADAESLIDEQSHAGGGQQVTTPAQTGGFDWFFVTWQKHPAAGPANARFALHYRARFQKDSVHDPQCVEFRQNAMTHYEVIAGPHLGDKLDTSPLHDDHYSRADDLAGRKTTELDFESEDNPGVHRGHLVAGDVIDYSFTAEQMLIDTCQGDKVIARIGPNTGTITGQDPRTYSGVPDVFETFG